MAPFNRKERREVSAWLRRCACDGSRFLHPLYGGAAAWDRAGDLLDAR